MAPHIHSSNPTDWNMICPRKSLRIQHVPSFPTIRWFREKWTNEPIAPKNKVSQNLLMLSLLLFFCWFRSVPMFIPMFFSFLDPWSTRCSHDFARICFYRAHGRWQTTLSRHLGLDGHWRKLVFCFWVDKNDFLKMKTLDVWGKLRFLLDLFDWEFKNNEELLDLCLCGWLCAVSFHSLRSCVILSSFPNILTFSGFMSSEKRCVQKNLPYLKNCIRYLDMYIK